MDIANLRPSNLIRALRNPQRAFLELIKFYQLRLLGHTGINIIEQDWDNLLILDACRYDTFEQENCLDGTLKAVRSQGSQTVQFLESNFNSGEFPEIVYVSANPNIKYIDATFHDRVRLWEDEWSDELETVPPEAVTKRAIQIEEKYPHKRLIIHYLQPHHPFIGEYGQSLYETGQIHNFDGRKFWNQCETVGAPIFRKAYSENLRVSLPHVEHLLNKLNGRSVVTSDHGNEFGCFDVYGHPSNTYTKGLIKVPWFAIKTDERKQIKTGSATVGPTTEESEVKQRLKDLGYVP